MAPRLVLLAFLLTCSLCLAEPPGKEKDSRDKVMFNEPGPVQLTEEGDRWAHKTLRTLSVEEKVGQLLMVRALAEFQNVESADYQRVRNEIQRFHVGSVLLTVRADNGLLLRNPPYEAAVMTNRLQSESTLPLLVAADFERGLSMRLLATPSFPHAMAFAATGRAAYAERFGNIVARESRAIGVHWNFFPVADINSNPANPIINTRSFGEDPQQVGEFLAAYIRGSRTGGALSTAKHFPGHGDTQTDSHLTFARSSLSLDDLHNKALPPFQVAIDAGVDAIMVAHVSVPALDPDPDKVATVSRRVISDVLLGEMRFAGLVVTDAMDMQALTQLYRLNAHDTSGRAAVDAILAGNDMVLLPSDLEGAFTGLVAAVRSGEITSPELDQRVLKVLRAKAAVNLHQGRLVDIEQIASRVGRPEDMALAQEIADAAVTLVRNDSAAFALLAEEKRRKTGTSPAAPPYDIPGAGGDVSGTLALIFTDSVRADWGAALERELKARVPDAKVMFIDPSLAAPLADTAVQAAQSAKVVILALYSVPSGGKLVRTAAGQQNSVSLSLDSAGVVERVLQVAAEKAAVVALGSPYLATDHPGTKTYLCTFSHMPTSEVAATKALFGEIPIRGRTPVTIPGLAARGAGIERNAVARRITPAVPGR